MIDIKQIFSELTSLYLNDSRPWIIGLSGGKDSTCVTQLIYTMLKKLSPEKRSKEVYILSSDTLVESPFIQERIKRICKRIQNQAGIDNLPITVQILRPELSDTFWTNLIGRGYPSPNKWFRWCTDRLKIRPMTRFTLEKVKENGEVIVVLGARKDESASRAQTLGKYAIKNFKLRKNTNMLGAFIYTPIEDWSFDDVWTYLLQAKSPWGDNNRELLSLYRKCDSECPLVIDIKTPACGGSRFGCWVCTVVERDRALEGLIESGEAWLEPLLEFRNWLKQIRDIPNYRESIRKSDRKRKKIAEHFEKDFNQTEHRGHKVLGPFTFETRHEIFKRLMELHDRFSKRGISLISPEEIKAIETLWIYEGDNIFSVLEVLDENQKSFSNNTIKYKNQLREICSRYGTSEDLIERLLLVEKDFSKLSRRRGIYNRVEKILDEYIHNVT